MIYPIKHYVYFLKVVTSEITLYKIGYSKDVKARAASLRSVEKPSSVVKGRGIRISSITVLHSIEFPNIEGAKQYEKLLKQANALYNYTGKPILPNGNTELFTINILINGILPKQ